MSIENSENKEVPLLEPKKETTEYEALVLSGGSSQGIVTLGAIQYAYDNFLLKNVTTYAGTSSGAMICYLLIIGFTPVEIIVYICTNQLMEKMQHFNIVAMMQGRGATSYHQLQDHLEKMTINKLGYLPTMNDLYEKHGKALVCATHNLTEGCTEYISHETHPTVPCLTALRMSANLPLVFESYKYGNSFYVDGGVSDNFPIHFRDIPKQRTLGILLGPEKTGFEGKPETNTLEFIYKLMFVPVHQATEHKIQEASDSCRIVRLAYDKVRFFDFSVNSKDKLDMFTSGYQQMENAIA